MARKTALPPEPPPPPRLTLPLVGQQLDLLLLLEQYMYASDFLVPRL